MFSRGAHVGAKRGPLSRYRWAQSVADPARAGVAKISSVAAHRTKNAGAGPWPGAPNQAMRPAVEPAPSGGPPSTGSTAVTSWVTRNTMRPPSASWRISRDDVLAEVWGIEPGGGLVHEQDPGVAGEQLLAQVHPLALAAGHPAPAPCIADAASGGCGRCRARSRTRSTSAFEGAGGPRRSGRRSRPA